VTLNPKEIALREKIEGFEKVWASSARLIQIGKQGIELKGKGKSHRIQDLIQKTRLIFLNTGFDEFIIPTIVEEREIYKQYGPEAPIILDRSFYLSALPRPDIGLSNEKARLIEELGITIDEIKKRKIQKVLRDYKRGKINSDDLVEKLSVALNTTDDKTIYIIRNVFPEFEALKPMPSTLTLRSHMTSSWFQTIRALQNKRTLPLKLFSIGMRFRREQSEDSTHLRTHHGASCVVVDKKIVEDAGARIAKTILNSLNLRNIKFLKKKVSSKYYTPGTEYEVYHYFPVKKKWIEVANFGLYSPIALAHYDIEYPALNLGIGLERIGMILHEEADIRTLVYFQLYTPWTLSDEELGKMVKISIEPKTAHGKKIREAIVKTAIANADKDSPCEYTAFNAECFDRKIKVLIYEKDENAKLLGPAALNHVYIHEGNILGIPINGMEHVKKISEARKKGIGTKIMFLDAIAAMTAAKIEEAVIKDGPHNINIRVKVAKLPSDVNIEVNKVAMHYITSARKEIIMKGPLFIGIRAIII